MVFICCYTSNRAGPYHYNLVFFPVSSDLFLYFHSIIIMKCLPFKSDFSDTKLVIVIDVFYR